MWNAVVDVGLPRPGTYSFILAAQKAGLKAHHAYVQTVAELGARWTTGGRPGPNEARGPGPGPRACP